MLTATAVPSGLGTTTDDRITNLVAIFDACFGTTTIA